MDEREVRELLRDAAESVEPGGDLADRAERRYRRRRVRGRVLVSAVAVALIGSGIATAEMVGTDHQPHSAVAPPPTSVPHAVDKTTSSTPSGSVDVRSIGALSFVDAKVGFGLVNGGALGTSAVVRTDDGGRTWRRVGVLAESESGVHFENASDGVVWGSGPLEWTDDGGAHWRAADGPVDNYLAWGGGRLWAMSPCVQSTPCGSRPLLISDNAGRTWQQTAVLQRGFGFATIVARSKSVAYIVEPKTDKQHGPWQLAVTKDGGGSWAYESLPCATWTDQPYLAANDSTLLLVCAGQPAAGNQLKQVWSSGDEGRRWTAAAGFEGGGYVSVLTTVGATFVAAMSRGDMWSSPDGGSWRRVTDTVEGFWSISTVPGVGAWAATGRADQHAGLLFSPDGVHWEQLPES